MLRTLRPRACALPGISPATAAEGWGGEWRETRGEGKGRNGGGAAGAVGFSGVAWAVAADSWADSFLGGFFEMTVSWVGPVRP
jgi:hypothetical protein